MYPNYPRPGRKRLAIDIPDNLHERITEIAERKNITLTKLVIRILHREAEADDKYNKTNNYNDINDNNDV